MRDIDLMNKGLRRSKREDRPFEVSNVRDIDLMNKGLRPICYVLRNGIVSVRDIDLMNKGLRRILYLSIYLNNISV